MTKVLAFVGGVVVGLPLLVLMVLAFSVWKTWWLYPTWEWFLVPLGVPSITFTHFWALVILLATIMPSHSETRKDAREIDWGKFAGMFLSAPLVWAALWLLK